ncbi:hypothetical protein D4764_17G0003560, partial [Takifugu flavidus]
MDPRWCPVLLAALAGSLCSSPARADRRFGCLFEDELCAPYEFCVNDPPPPTDYFLRKAVIFPLGGGGGGGKPVAAVYEHSHVVARTAARARTGEKKKICLKWTFKDGVFGRCQELAGADLHTYQLSSSALQRLRILLQKLARKGTRACHCLSAFIPRRQ